MRKKCLLIMVTMLLTMLCLGGCGAKEEVSDAGAVQYVPAGSMDTVLKNENYELTMKDNYSVFEIKDMKTGTVWSSIPRDENFHIEDMKPLWQKKSSSWFQIGYTNLLAGLGVIVNSPLLQMDYTAGGYVKDDQLYVAYDLKQPAIKLTFAFSLEEDGFRVRILHDSIEEYGEDFSLVSVGVLPYMGGATDSAEGYYLYPDGSGAIMEFQDIVHVGDSGYSYEIYGDIKNYEEMQLDFSEGRPKVMLPVYGVNLNNEGYVGVVTEGEGDARIVVSCSTKMVNLNTIYGEFLFRRGFEDSRVKDKIMVSYTEDMIPGDREIYYRFLESGNTDYSAMAECYRNYLLEQEYTYGAATGELPLLLDIFMGIEEDGLVLDEFKNVTDFEQAEEMLTAFSDAGVDGLKINLKGYTHGGYNSEPLRFTINSSLGGKKGLKDFLATAKERSVPVTLDANVAHAWEDEWGFSTRTDVVITGNFMVLTDDDEELFLLSPEVSEKKLNRFVKKASAYDIDGYRLSNVASALVYNYNEGHEFSSGDTIALWERVLAGIAESNLVAVNGGNAYALKYAELLGEIPDSDMGYKFTTRAVPFYQLVTHGLAAYSNVAGNLSGEMQTTMLKWIEYGYVPYFELTYDGSEELMYTSYNELFTSTYENWFDTVVEVYGEMQENVGHTWNQVMTEHTCLEKDVYRTTYADGTRVYVNYAGESKTVDGITIAALDYTVVKGEE